VPNNFGTGLSAPAVAAAGAADALAVSISDIGVQVGQSTAVIDQAVAAGGAARATIETLKDRVGQIGEARSATSAAVAAVVQIETTIEEVNTIAGSIAAAVLQQGTATAVWPFHQATPDGTFGQPCFTRNRSGARWHDNGGTGMMRGDRGIYSRCVISAIAGGRCDRPDDWIEQRPHLRTVIDVVPGQFSGDDLTGVSIQVNVQFPPGPARLGAMLLHLLFRRGRLSVSSCFSAIQLVRAPNARMRERGRPTSVRIA
jgi:hypothetical protein